MKIAAVMILVGAIALARPHAASAQELECGPYVQKAQAAIDKVTDDMKGMESMPKDQLLEVHTLLDDARMYLDGARHNCDKPQAEYDRARAIGKAEAAAGYATAADMLHFQFMKGTAGMKGHDMGSGSTPMGGMGGMKGMGGAK